MESLGVYTERLSSMRDRRRPILLTPAVRVPLDAAADLAGTGADLSADAVNVRSCAAATLASTRAVMTGQYANLTTALPTDGAPIDVSGCPLLRLRFRVNDPANILGIVIKLRSNAVNWTNNFVETNNYFWIPATKGLGDGYWYEKWFTCDAPEADYGWAETGAMDWTSVKSIWIQVVSTNGSAYGGDITFDELAWFPYPTRVPRLFLMFDDFTANHYPMACYMASLGLRGTFYAIGNTMAANLSKLLALRDMDHLVGNHSWAHGYPPGTAAAALLGEYQHARDYMAANGLAAGAEHYAIPGGGFDPTIHYAWLGKQCKTIRSTDVYGWYAPFPDPAGREKLTISGYDDAAAAEAGLARMQVDGMDRSYLFHQMTAAPASMAQVKAFMVLAAAAQAAGLVTVNTIDEV